MAGVASGSGAPIPSPGAPLEDIALTPKERAEVLSGEIIVREVPSPGKPGRTLEAVGLLAGRLDQAYAVITDFRRYAEFMPNVKRALVKEEGGAVSIVEIEIGLPLGQSRRYRLKYECRMAGVGALVTWRKIPWPELRADQTVRDTGGRWLVRKSEGRGLVASYLVYTDPSPVPLGLTGIAGALGKKSMPDMIESVKRRMRALFPPEGERRGPQNSRP